MQLQIKYLIYLKTTISKLHYRTASNISIKKNCITQCSGIQTQSKISPIVWRNDKWYWQICSKQSSSLRYLNLFSYFSHEVLSDIKMHCNEFICLCHTHNTNEILLHWKKKKNARNCIVYRAYGSSYARGLFACHSLHLQ